MSSFSLLNNQLDPYNYLCEYIRLKKRVIVLSGSSGVGKTFTFNKYKYEDINGPKILQFNGNSLINYEDFYVFNSVFKEKNKTSINPFELIQEVSKDLLKFENSLSYVQKIFKLKKDDNELFRDQKYSEKVSFLSKLVQKGLSILHFDNISLYDPCSLNLLKEIIIRQSTLEGLTTIILEINTDKDMNFYEWLLRTQVSFSLVDLQRPTESDLAMFIAQKVTHNNTDTSSMLKLTNGDMHLVQLILHQLRENNHSSFKLSTLDSENFKVLMNQILSQNINKLEDRELVDRLLKFGACIGISFTHYELEYITKTDLYKILNALELAVNYNFTEKQDEQLYMFSHEFVRMFFCERINNSKDKIEYYRKVEKSLAFFNPENYNLRSEYALKSGDIEKCSELVVLSHIYSLRNENKSIVNDTDFILKPHIDFLINIKDAYSLYFEGDFEKCIERLQLFDGNICNCFDFEKEYLLAIARKKIFHQTNDMNHSIVNLEFYYKNKVELEQWLRGALLLLALYYDCNHDPNKTIELYKEIEREISVRSKNSKYYLKQLNILKRKARIHYTTKIAVKHSLESLTYFENSTDVKEYIYSLCNYSGNLINIGMYSKAYDLTKHYLSDLDKCTILNNLYLINNAILAGVYSNNLRIELGIQNFEFILSQKINNDDRIILRNNYLVLTGLNRNFQEAKEGFYQLLKLDIVSSEDYYYYFVKMNLVTTLILAGDYDESLKCFEEVKDKIPSISLNDDIFLKLRAKCITQIIENRVMIDNGIDNFDTYIIENSNPDLVDEWQHLGRMYLTSDLQYWSE